ncbi:MAG TPA: outer membrane protein assembly factor BamD [Nitrospira sp.]|uniref:outer membrane protein assembly factor BamD n=1 Tax=Cognatazoarcus halotolerans TaxID=2686016 RepID=UPI0013582E18|nr:outer membrane protein assembly factor BamD [Cognatazoarcus halotolerans]MBX3680249.1 outer membrane protein assembly factor BamD [Rhodocyclaceae bacterium]MCB1902368.1 outer membrane protein assembly factor BamD [Rhodocyclaceae bacterium]MCP5309664.1 outer membrane protein assembly factor BamD [Zoogloeaceae bacterium]HQV11995.1 outer membrane protein assembly factor BamD [Nitrospira sp.]
MANFTRRSLALIAVLLLSGCGSLPEEKDETAGWSAQRIYSEASESMTDGGYDRAIKLFEKLEARYPYGRYAQQAQLEAAYAYYKSGEAALAVAACDRFIKLHPDHPNVDYAYYLKGLVHFNEDLGLLGNLANQDLSERDPAGAKESFDTFRELVTRFPESKYAADASQRMQYLINSLGAHEVHVARYYYKRGAYLAAVNRAAEALKSFPNTPSNEEALFIMVKGYDALELPELRDDADRVLRKSFPNSTYLLGSGANGKPWWKLW